MQETQTEQTAPAAPVAAPVPTEITLTLQVKEVELVLGALAKLPLEAVADLFFKIRNTAAMQVQSSGEPK